MDPLLFSGVIIPLVHSQRISRLANLLTEIAWQDQPLQMIRLNVIFYVRKGAFLATNLTDNSSLI